MKKSKKNDRNKLINKKENKTKVKNKKTMVKNKKTMVKNKNKKNKTQKGRGIKDDVVAAATLLLMDYLEDGQIKPSGIVGAASIMGLSHLLSKKGTIIIEIQYLITL